MQTNTTPVMPTREQVEAAIVRAYNAIKGASQKAGQSDVTKSVADTLTKYSDDIQNMVNAFMKKRGAVTQDQLDELDEKIREAKKRTLEAESKNTLVRYGLYLSVAIVSFGALWLITREKK